VENAHGWQVINTFAYTGSLGVASLFAGARRVIQVDHNRKFLQLARRSGILNHLDIGKMKLEGKNFYHYLAWLRRERIRFDCAIVDPPLFSQTKHGVVDLVNESERLINKVRPVVEDGGYLVLVNNALFVSGEMYIRSLGKLCNEGFLEIKDLIAVPADITGFQQTIVASPPSDPSPYNHPTKITVLRIKRK
jgi:23S rRNA (cytosine1962-C5)-methyltransferase